MTKYFNYRTYFAETPWERRRFLKSWWKMQSIDRRWIPPYAPNQQTLVHAHGSPHLARLSPQCLYLEALPHRSTRGEGMGYSGALMEQPVATAALLFDRRRRDGSAHLGLLAAANDPESMEHLFMLISEQLWQRGYQRVIGPTGLSPHLSSGVLHNYFHQVPPLHTPYNPPYLPEVAASVLHPLATTRLFVVPTPQIQPHATGPAQLTPLVPRRLSQSLLLLLAAACDPLGEWFPPPDYAEAAFLLQQLSFAPLFGWLARVDRRPVGFVLLQPDVGRALQRARGGRNPLWRTWLRWRVRRNVPSGRLLFGGVLPAWRGRGIGRQLFQQALQTARQRGWEKLTVGPLPESAPAARFLAHYGASAQQGYTLYTSEL